ncbi:WD40 repeat domain-containing serine/threonine protein kinase [Murinocardiopsis flavida]|uniref:WD40 repeat domain-containing serine/threonine protein kinase n=1 Tax=Murinocardiopsis flavida TaxID=645275 RepID=UPI001475294D|nr:serine/threonine-protein kinase [Murinocardiopsis flavida]
MEPLEPSDPARIGGYQLTHRLGEGGMGRVYLATTPSGRHVAVKVIRPALVREGDFRVRFAREVDAARRVGGFHTAPVVDADPAGDPAWIATAYIPGPTLHQAVRDGGPIMPPALYALAVGLAEGLKAVHDRGLVHRDLKPGNIILSDDGPRIIDFGIARPLDSESLTTREAVFGTLPYMSPEQTENSHVGPASDMFSLGTVLAYAATGDNPFNGDSMAATVRRLIGPPPDPGDVDPRTREVILGCWNPDPDQRPTPEAVLARFGTIDAGGVGGVEGVGVVGRPPDTARPSEGPGGSEPTTRPPAPTFIEAEPATGAPVPTFAAAEPATHPPAPTLVAAGPATSAPLPHTAADRPTDGPVRPRLKRAWLIAAALAVVTTVITAGVVALRTGGEDDRPGSPAAPPEPAATLTGHEDAVNSVVFSPDGTTLATSDTKFSVRLWDTDTWKETTTLIDDKSLQTMGSPVVAFDPDGSRLATAHESVQLWDSDTWEETSTLADDEWITSVAFSSDGTTLATSDPVGNVRLWDTDAEEETDKLSGPPDYITSLAFSPDGATLATGTAVDTAEVFEDSDGGAIRLWDTDTGDEIDIIAKNDPSFESVVFSPDGSKLAACSSGTVRMWDTGTWAEDTTLPKRVCTFSLAFSPDGAALATGDGDGTVRLWDTDTWKENAVFSAEERVDSVGFSPDGGTVAAGHSDGTVHLWKVG